MRTTRQRTRAQVAAFVPDPHQILLFDLETVRMEDRVMQPFERVKTTPHGARITQLALLPLVRVDVEPFAHNINPQVQWSHVGGLLRAYTGKCWQLPAAPKRRKTTLVERLEIAAEAYPTLDQVWPALVKYVRDCVGMRAYLAAHNGSAWDAIILAEDMKRHQLKWPDDMVVTVWDTRQYLRCNSHGGPKWSLKFLYDEAFVQPLMLLLQRVVYELPRETLQLIVSYVSSPEWHTALGDALALRALLNAKMAVSGSLAPEEARKHAHTPLQPTGEIKHQAPQVPQATRLEIQAPQMPQASRVEIQAPQAPQASRVEIQAPQVPQASRTESKHTTLVNRRLKEGVVPGLGRSTCARLRFQFQIQTFGHLFQLYQSDQQFAVMLNQGVIKHQARLSADTIRVVTTFARAQRVGATVEGLKKG